MNCIKVYFRIATLHNVKTNTDTQCLLLVTTNKTGIDCIAVPLGTRGKKEQVWHTSSFNKTQLLVCVSSLQKIQLEMLGLFRVCAVLRLISVLVYLHSD